MSSIIERKINNATYIVESISFRDKKGRPRSKQKCLGRLDDDGVLISSKRKLPAQIKKVRTVKTKYIIEDKKNSPAEEQTGEQDNS